MPETKESTKAKTTTTAAKAAGVSGLVAKLLVAQRAAGAVGKAGKNEAQGYAYAKAEDVIEEARKALHSADLVAFMVPGEREVREVASNSGSAGLFVTLDATLVIIDPDAPDQPLEIPAVGTGIDYPGDKAIYKAKTGAAKYAYSSALGIPFGDDPENEIAGAGQERARGGVGGSTKEASSKQKRAITTILSRGGVPKEVQAAIVHAIAGNPPTISGASEILDIIAPAKGDELKGAIDQLYAKAEVSLISDVPGDDAGLPAEADAAASAAEGGQFPPQLPPEPGGDPDEGKF